MAGTNQMQMMIESYKKGKEKKSDGYITVVLELNLSSEDTARRAKGVLQGFGGVDHVESNVKRNLLMVTGNVDPVKIRARVAEGMVRKVELILVSPAAPAGGGDKRAVETSGKQPTTTLELKMEVPWDNNLQNLLASLNCNWSANRRTFTVNDKENPTFAKFMKGALWEWLGVQTPHFHGRKYTLTGSSSTTSCQSSKR